MRVDHVADDESERGDYFMPPGPQRGGLQIPSPLKSAFSPCIHSQTTLRADGSHDIDKPTDVTQRRLRFPG